MFSVTGSLFFWLRLICKCGVVGGGECVTSYNSTWIVKLHWNAVSWQNRPVYSFDIYNFHKNYVMLIERYLSQGPKGINNDKQNYRFCRLKLAVETFEHTT